MANLAVGVDSQIRRVIRRLQKQGKLLVTRQQLSKHIAGIQPLIDMGIPIATIAEDLASIDGGVLGSPKEIAVAIASLLNETSEPKKEKKLRGRSNSEEEALSSSGDLNDETNIQGSEDSSLETADPLPSSNNPPSLPVSQSSPTPTITNRRSPEVEARLQKNRSKSK
jgi:hypothetical protein